MYLAGSLSAAGRHTFVTLGLAAALLAVPSAVSAQDAPAAAPPTQTAPAAQPKDDFLFSAVDAGLIIWYVPVARVAAFEEAWATIMAKLNASDKPEHKEVASTLRIFKPTSAPAAGQPITYFLIANPASKTASYSPVELIFKSGLFTATPPDPTKDSAFQQELFKKLPLPGEPDGANVSVVPLKKLQ